MRESFKLGLALLLIVGSVNFFFYWLGKRYMKWKCPTLYRLSTEPQGRVCPPSEPAWKKKINDPAAREEFGKRLGKKITDDA
jgi:hypothetical protein